jgi:hypothetical protein
LDVARVALSLQSSLPVEICYALNVLSIVSLDTSVGFSLDTCREVAEPLLGMLEKGLPARAKEWEGYFNLYQRSQMGSLWAHVGTPAILDRTMCIQMILRNLSFQPPNQTYLISRGADTSRLLVRMISLDFPLDPHLSLESRKNALIILSNIATGFILRDESVDLIIRMLIDFISVESCHGLTPPPPTKPTLQPYRLYALDTLAKLSVRPENKKVLQACLKRGGLSHAIPVLLKCIPAGCIIMPEVKGTDLPLLLTWEFSLIVINLWIEDLGMHHEFARSLGGGIESIFYKRLLSIAASELNLLPTPVSDGRGKGLGGLGMYFPSICARSMRLFIACVGGCCAEEGELAREFERWERELARILQRIGKVDDGCSMGAADCLWEVSRCLY